MSEKREIKYHGGSSGSRSGRSHGVCLSMIRQATSTPGVTVHFWAKSQDGTWARNLIPLVKSLVGSGLCEILESGTAVSFSNGSRINLILSSRSKRA